MALVAAALVGVATFAMLFENRPDPTSTGTWGADEATAGGNADSATNSAGRPVYVHSVIPGGVFTADELHTVLVEDAVAAAHYSKVDAAAIRPAILKQDRYAYVSYRKNGQIYWTRNKVRLAAGETILTDGKNEIRARCGNCISETPMLPVAEAEPDLAELDRLVDGSEPDEPALAAVVDSALEPPVGVLAQGGSGAPADGGTVTGGAGSVGTPSGGNGSLAGFGGIGPTGGSGSPAPTSFAPGGPWPGGDNPSNSNPIGGGPPWTGPGSGGPSDNPGNPFPPNNAGGPWIPPGIDPPPGYTPPPGGGNPPPGTDVDPPPGGGPSNPPPGGPNNPPGGGPEEPPPASPGAPPSVPEPGLMILVGGGAAVALARKFRRN